jgi:hypothetical protein
LFFYPPFPMDRRIFFVFGHTNRPFSYQFSPLLQFVYSLLK